MKFYIILSILFFGLTSCNAQNIERHVFSNGGLNGQDGTIIISSTIGEPIDKAFSDSQILLKQGFEQPLIDTVISSISFNELEVNISVYPIPTNDILYVKIEDLEDWDLVYRIYDLQGKSFNTESITSTIQSINVSELAAGTYLLKIYSTKYPITQSIKFQKIK